MLFSIIIYLNIDSILAEGALLVVSTIVIHKKTRVLSVLLLCGFSVLADV